MPLAQARRLLELADRLIDDRPLEGVLQTAVEGILSVRGVDGVAVLLPGEDRLRSVAAGGRPFEEIELQALRPESAIPLAVGLAGGDSTGVRTLALVAGSRPIGLLVLRGVPITAIERDALASFVAHVALALERVELRAEAVQVATLQRTDELRRLLLATTAHDLRGPLAVMQVLTESLGLAQSSAKTSELHAMLNDQIGYMTRLVNGLLDVARYESGVLAVAAEPHSVAALVDEAMRLGSTTTGPSRVVLDIPDALPAVQADALLIIQVLTNLLENAKRYGPPGTPITVAARHRRDVVQLSVADRGPGIPRGHAGALFDPFVRHDEGGRAGLGLAIAKAFVQAHGQRIWADASGPGARFTFTLAVAPREWRPAAGGAPSLAHRLDPARA